MLRVGLFSRLVNSRLLYSTKMYTNVQSSVDKYTSVFGRSAGEYLGKQLKKINPNNREISIKEKKVSLDLINSVLYPVKDFPIDLAESLLKKIHKKKPDSITVSKLLNSNIIKQRRKARSIISKNSAVGNCLESMSLSENEIFKIGQNRLNPEISNYSSEKERAVSRLASGLVPAVFFANDAYNQSMMINNNKKEAKLEKKKRFKQEVSRIGIMAYAQYVVLGALSKFVNKNALTSLAVTTGIVAGTEMLSRVIAGKPVTFVKSKHQNDEEHPLVDIANDKTTIKHSSKALKIAAGMFAAGAAAVSFKSSSLGKKLTPAISNIYNKLIKKDIYISKKEFNSIIKKLNDNGFENLAKKYQTIAAKQNTKNIFIGTQNRKGVYTVVDSIIMTPIKAVYDISTLPFKMFSKNKTPIVKQSEENLLQGISYIKSIQNRPDFKEKLNKKILSSFDNKTKTNYSNHNLAKYSKIATSSASSYFIVADSYNMVMQKENNKENAKKVSKKVLLQRGVNIGMGAYILTILNNMFKVKYNKSLYCVAMVSGLFGLLNEGLSRLVVGIPVTEKTREEQLKFKQGYSKVMNKFT